MYALGALSAELIFAQAILREIGLSFPDTQHAQWQRNNEQSKDETHSHKILIHLRFGISETFNTVISQDRCESE